MDLPSSSREKDASPLDFLRSNDETAVAAPMPSTTPSTTLPGTSATIFAPATIEPPTSPTLLPTAFIDDMMELPTLSDMLLREGDDIIVLIAKMRTTDSGENNFRRGGSSAGSVPFRDPSELYSLGGDPDFRRHATHTSCDELKCKCKR